MALSGTLPYIFSGSIPNFTNAFFETISGYTTTGSSILQDIESLPYGILFWRSLTHWIGGIGHNSFSYCNFTFVRNRWYATFRC